MENEELKNKLIGKLEKELAEFKDSLMELSSKEIIDSSYKITCMETIQDYLAYDKDYSKFELKTLLKREHILEECYDDWLDSDGSFREVIEFSVDDTIDLIRDNEVKKDDKNKKTEILVKIVNNKRFIGTALNKNLNPLYKERYNYEKNK